MDIIREMSFNDFMTLIKYVYDMETATLTKYVGSEKVLSEWNTTNTVGKYRRKYNKDVTFFTDKHTFIVGDKVIVFNR